MPEIDNAIRNHEMIRLALKAGAKLSNDNGVVEVEKDGQVVLFGIPTRFDAASQTVTLSRWQVSLAAVADTDYTGLDVMPLDKPTDDYGVPTETPSTDDVRRWWTENPEAAIGIDTRDGARGSVTI